MISWFKNLFYIVKNYSTDHKRTIDLLKAQRERMAALDKLIKDRTNIVVDTGYLKGANYVILAGHYKNRDYVQVVTLRGGDFVDMVNQIKSMQQHGRVQRIDAPPPFMAVLDRELFE